MHLDATTMFTLDFYTHLTVELTQFVNYLWAML